MICALRSLRAPLSCNCTSVKSFPRQATRHYLPSASVAPRHRLLSARAMANQQLDKSTPDSKWKEVLTPEEVRVSERYHLELPSHQQEV